MVWGFCPSWVCFSMMVKQTDTAEEGNRVPTPPCAWAPGAPSAGSRKGDPQEPPDRRARIFPSHTTSWPLPSAHPS